MSGEEPLLVINKKKVLAREISVYQLEGEKQLLYYKHSSPQKLFTKYHGQEVVAHLPHKNNSYNCFGAHEHKLYFFSVIDGKIKRVLFTSPVLSVATERDIRPGEEMHEGALCSRVVNGRMLVYRMCDDPDRDATLIDYPAEELRTLRLIAVKSGKAIFVKEIDGLTQPMSRRLTENAIVIMIGPHAVFAVDKTMSNLYIGLNQTMFTFRIYAGEFASPRRLSCGVIKSIVGFDDVGNLLVTVLDNNEYYLCTTTLCPLTTSEELADMHATSDNLDKFLKGADFDNYLDDVEFLERSFQNLRTRFGLPGGTVQSETSQSASRQFDSRGEYSSRFLSEFSVRAIRGEGGFGTVFEAVNKVDNYRYAVKRIAVSAEEKEKALREVRAMAQLDHVGIVRYNSAWIEEPPVGRQREDDDGILRKLDLKIDRLNTKYKMDSMFIYIQMQLYNSSLSDWLQANQKQESRELSRMREWFRQIVSAVEFIHGNGIIHRDLKPSNILFADRDALKVCDLGITTERRDLDETDTTVSRTAMNGCGTALYQSPEQSSFLYGNKVDVFTLGLILTELCVVMNSGQRKQLFNSFRRGVKCYLIEDSQMTNLVTQLLQLDPKNRPTCTEVLKQLS